MAMTRYVDVITFAFAFAFCPNGGIVKFDDAFRDEQTKPAPTAILQLF